MSGNKSNSSLALLFIALFVCNAHTLLAQALLYQKGQEIGVYNPGSEERQVLIAHTKAHLSGYQMQDDLLMIFLGLNGQTDTVQVDEKELRFRVYAREPSKLRRTKNGYDLGDEQYLKERNHNIILCDKGFQKWKYVGSKGTAGPGCEDEIDEKMTGFEPYLSMSRRYIIFGTHAGGGVIFIRQRIIVLEAKTGKLLKTLNGFLPVLAAEGDYFIYHNGYNGAVRVFDLIRNKAVGGTYKNAYWLNKD